MTERSVIPWSFSTYEAYQTCPKQFYEMRIAKNFKEREVEERDWGNDVHEELKLHVEVGKPLEGRYATYAPLMQQIMKAPGDFYPELETAVDHDLQDTGYWDEGVWNRGKEDLVIVNKTKAVSIDYKTGKNIKPRSRQLELSACRVMAKFPQVQVVNTAFAWLQFPGKWTRATYTRDQLNALWSGFFDPIAQMIWSQENNVWPAKPSGLCKKSKRPGSTYGGCPVASCPHSEFFRRGT